MQSYSDAHIFTFLADCCVTASPKNCIGASRLYDAYAVYTTKQGIRKDYVLGRKAFGVRMSKLFKRKSLNGGRFYMGIRLKLTEPSIKCILPLIQ